MEKSIGIAPLPFSTGVEVFKTNVHSQQEAGILLSDLLVCFPEYNMNFDLEDCDRILRVEGAGIDAERIRMLMLSYGWSCSVLEDNQVF